MGKRDRQRLRGLVVGLEARREFDLGELRERRRLILLPLLGAVFLYGGIVASTRLQYGQRKPLFTVLAGLAVGLATSAYVPQRDALDKATTGAIQQALLASG